MIRRVFVGRVSERSRVVALLTMIALLCSCAGKLIEVDGVTLYEEIWENTVRTLSTRVEFDFDCDQTPEFTLIVRRGRHPSEVGVRACGKTGTYLRGRRDLWILQGTAGRGTPVD